jgi:hypothetical protein
MQCGQNLNVQSIAPETVLVAPAGSTFHRQLAKWRSLDAQVSLGDPHTDEEEQQYAGVVEDRDALALRILVTPATEPLEIISKLDILESELRIAAGNDQDGGTGRELLFLGAIRADLMALRQKRAFDQFALTEALASARRASSAP